MDLETENFQIIVQICSTNHQSFYGVTDYGHIFAATDTAKTNFDREQKKKSTELQMKRMIIMKASGQKLMTFSLFINI